MSLAASPALGRPGVRRLLLAYLELTKPRIVFLVLLTGVPALLLAARGEPALRPTLAALLGTALAAAAASCFNHYLDRDIDARMQRTCQRPLPSGRITPAAALALGFLLAAAAWVVLLAFGNLLAAVIGELSIVYYGVIYTMWLKRRTPQNIVIGGGAGASAPLIAWAAVTGAVGLPAVLMAAIVFLWTPPHFWSLALVRHEDYLRARIPMLPVTHGELETRRQILAYTLVLVPVTLALVPLGIAGPVYGIPAAILGAAFVHRAWRLARRFDAARALGLFRFSILYLFVLFVALTADALIRGRG